MIFPKNDGFSIIMATDTIILLKCHRTGSAQQDRLGALPYQYAVFLRAVFGEFNRVIQSW
jgi:hypothetical protein